MIVVRTLSAKQSGSDGLQVTLATLNMGASKGIGAARFQAGH